MDLVFNSSEDVKPEILWHSVDDAGDVSLQNKIKEEISEAELDIYAKEGDTCKIQMKSEAHSLECDSTCDDYSIKLELLHEELDLKMSSTDEAGPSQRKRACLQTAKTSKWARKRPLTIKELEYEANRSLREEDELYPSSESEFEPTDNFSSNAEEDEEVEQVQQDNIQGSTIAQPTEPTPSSTMDWASDSAVPNNIKIFDFTKNREMLVLSPGNSPIDFFFLLFDDDFMNFIVQETNKNAVNVLSTSISEKSRISAWKDLTINEFKIFLGLLFHMGMIPLSRIQTYWKKDRLFDFPLFREQMSRNRFLLILRCLHFYSEDEVEEERNKDVLKRIRPLIDYFNNKMESIYYPGKQLSLDESMMLWRGRLRFGQYIKNKRHKYGIKLYMLTEPNGTVLRIRVYTGANDADVSGAGHASKVVLKLVEGFLDNGHALYMDNFYNSFSLSKQLLDRKTYSTGTLRANLKENPSDIDKKKIKIGENVSAFKDGIHIGKWKDKREVMYITTQFDNEFQLTANRRGVQKQKPLAIVEYNKYMSGIDHQVQLLSYYPCERKTIRWYKKLFIHVLQLLTINSLKLYNAYSGNQRMTMYDFRISIINALLPIKTAVEVAPRPSRCEKPAHSIVKINEQTRDKGNTLRIKRKQCRQCTRDGKGRKQTTYMCNDCEDKPGLCPQCFDKYHNFI